MDVARLDQGQRRRERRRKCVRGGFPHRLEIEHVHGRAVDQSRLGDRQGHAEPEQRGSGLPALLGEVIGENLRRRLHVGAGHRNRDAVEQEPARRGS